MRSESNPNIQVSSPSNIAFVKYWGKYKEQLPINSSISMTLNKSRSFFDITLVPKEKRIVSSFLFENQSNESFEKKMEEFLRKIDLNILKNFSLNIKCHNSFPHSSGIASSASSMSALIYGLLSLDNEISNSAHSLSDMSYYARLGSGSASRSLFPHFSIWDFKSPESATQMNEYHKDFLTLKDAILIIDEDKKEVSSSLGHSLMDKNPYKEIRIDHATNNLNKLLIAMKDNDKKTFGKILEDEALTLHALMMTSDPSFILMKPNTLIAIKKIKNYREETGLPVYFTLDAGANLHLLYFCKNEKDIHIFIENELKTLCSREKVIYDEIGDGPIIHKISL